VKVVPIRLSALTAGAHDNYVHSGAHTSAPAGDIAAVAGS
jgi:hypothetical protein